VISDVALTRRWAEEAAEEEHDGRDHREEGLCHLERWCRRGERQPHHDVDDAEHVDDKPIEEEHARDWGEARHEVELLRADE
jgi:hypothetical protein